MKLTLKGLWLGLLVDILASIAAIFAVMQITDLTIIFALVASIIAVFFGRILTGSYSNFTVLFLVFSALYGLSGPIVAYYGEGLPRTFPTPYLVDEFLLHYLLALIGLVVGLMLVAGVRMPPRSTTINQVPTWNGQTLFLLSLVFIAMASFMELINFVRAGGLETLFAGKAAYQSAVSELTMTLPTEQVILLATAFLGLALSSTKLSSRTKLIHVGQWILISLPPLMSLTVLGRRGELLAIIFVFIFSYFFFKPIRKISLKFVVLFICIYFMFGFLYGARAQLGYGLATGNWSILKSQLYEREFWVSSLNPGSIEFGAPFGNFNTHILLKRLYEPRLGETYLIGLTIPIPRFIWPDKPRSITYEFRDAYFPQAARRGAIAGTAFSSILEAYINFGTAGVPIVYLFIALAVGLIEHARSHSRSLSFAIFYLKLLPEAVTFHRSSLGMPLFWPLILAFVGLYSYIFLNSILQKFSRSVITGRVDIAR